MIFERLIFIPLILLFATSLALLLFRDWKICLPFIFIQYLAIFWMTALLWPPGLAAVKLVAGWMAGAVLGISQMNLDEPPEKRSLGMIIFRFLSAIIIWLVVINVAPAIQAYIPIKREILTSGILLIGMGLLQLGMTTRVFPVVLGLLTLFSGFELIYAGIESAVLVAGLLAGINLGLAGVGAYLLTNPTVESGS